MADETSAPRPLHKAERLTWLKDARDWLRLHGDNPIPFQDRATRFAAVAVEYADQAAALLAERSEPLAILRELDALREGCAPDELGAVAGKQIAAFVLRYRAAHQRWGDEVTALPYATFREDMADAIGNLEDFTRVLEDSKCYLASCRRSLDYATGTAHELEAFAKDVDALVAKVETFQRALTKGRM